jgi:hypothetical protein
MISSPHTKSDGTLKIPLSTLENHTNLMSKELVKTIEEISDKVLYRGGCFFIRNFTKRQSSSNTFLQGALKHVQETPFYSEWLGDNIHKLDTLCIPYPSVSVSDTVSETELTLSLKPSDSTPEESKKEEASPKVITPKDAKKESLRAIARRLWFYWREKRLKTLPSCRPPANPTDTDLALIEKILKLSLPCPDGKDNEWYCRRAIEGAYGDREGLKWTQVVNIFRNYQNIVRNYTKAEEQGGLYHR